MDEDSTQLRCLKNSLVSFFPMRGGLSVRDRALAWSGREDVFGFGQIASMTEQPSVNSISRPWGWRLRHLVYTTGRAHTFVCGNDYCIISFCNYKSVKVGEKKRHSTLLDVREMQMKTTVRYHFSPTEMAMILLKERK